jgi:hypothetical protein
VSPVTGEGKSHAAASIIGLGMDPRHHKHHWILPADQSRFADRIFLVMVDVDAKLWSHDGKTFG